MKTVQTRYTMEEREALKKVMEMADFSEGQSLHKDPTQKPETTRVRNFLSKFVTDAWNANLPSMGISTNMMNSSEDHPVNRLRIADTDCITELAAMIYQDKEAAQEAIELFCIFFSEPLNVAIQAYCRCKKKPEDGLNAEDANIIMRRVAETANKEMLLAVMLGQQVPELFQLADEMPTHEDFSFRLSNEKISFFEAWNHSKTKIGIMLSTEELTEDALGSMSIEEEVAYRVLRDAFMEQLDEEDKTIFSMREAKNTQAEIAEALGYSSPSTVSKHLQSMRKRFDEFIAEREE